MKPVDFEHSNKVLQPSGQKYSDNVKDVSSLPVWTDGEQCVSCWQMSWRERLSALFFGTVWLAVLNGTSQPPVSVRASRGYFIEAD